MMKYNDRKKRTILRRSQTFRVSTVGARLGCVCKPCQPASLAAPRAQPGPVLAIPGLHSVKRGRAAYPHAGA